MQFSLRERLSYIKITRVDILVYSVLAAIVLMAAALRLLPIQWGVYLDEFDPYIQFKGMEYTVQNGFAAWFTWFDPTRWAPWGVNVPSQMPLGVPFTGAAAYMFLQFIGINVSTLDVAAFWPVFSGAVMVVLVFGIGKVLVNRGVGLLSAFIFAIDPTSIQRTSLGFFDTESVGLLGMFIAVLFFVLSLKKNTIPYAIVSGLGLALMALSWGAYLYPLNLFALFVIVLALIGKWNKRVAVSFTIIASITMFTLAVSPNNGLSAAVSPYTVASIMAILISIVMGVTEFIPDKARRRLVSVLSVLGIVGAMLVMLVLGVFGEIGFKFLLFLNPFLREGSPVVGTVGEQFPAIWYSFFANFHALVVLAPVGAYMAIKRLKSKDVFIVLFAIAAIYGASSYIRLLIIVAPALSLLAGMAITSVFAYAMSIIRSPDDRKSKGSTLTKWYGILAIALVLGAMVPLAYENVRSSNRPAMIVSASSNYAANIPDWQEALAWMRSNLPEGSVVAEWWDYGYWINVMGNQTAISDNNTSNETQIKLIARAFLNNETFALETFKSLNVTHVVVYEPWYGITVGNYTVGLPPWSSLGDFEKSTAMMTIAGHNATQSYDVALYIQNVPLSTGSGTTYWPLPAGPKANTTFLYQMLFGPWRNGYAQLGVDIEPLNSTELVYHSSSYWVLIYELNYP
jgi:dolichyl-diphosphooligosaccharide--protein glycosyltransferase